MHRRQIICVTNIVDIRHKIFWNIAEVAHIYLVTFGKCYTRKTQYKLSLFVQGACLCEAANNET